MAATPTRVPTATTRSPVRITLRGPRRAGPDHRFARVSTPSTPSANTGRRTADSISQVANGVPARWVAPIAPCSDTSQKPQAHDIAAASVSTVAQGTPSRAGRTARERWIVDRVDMTASALWSGDGGVVIAVVVEVRAERLGGDLPAEHHRVVLVGQVVAVRDVRAGEVPEPAVQDHRLARVQRGDVLAAEVV